MKQTILVKKYETRNLCFFMNIDLQLKIKMNNRTLENAWDKIKNY